MFKFFLNFFNIKAAKRAKRVVDTGLRERSIIEKTDGILNSKKLFLNCNLSISALAREVGTNRTYLSRAIVHQRATTFRGYINMLRIVYAKSCVTKNLASNADEPINVEDLAILSGFGSKRNFVRYFKLSEGITPGQFIKRARWERVSFKQTPP